MDDVVLRFSLLRLPNNAILNTLRSMDYQQIFGISILSKNTKSLVEFLKLTTRSFVVHITLSFKIQLFISDFQYLSLELYQNNDNEPLQELETPGSFCITYNNASETWTNLMSVKQLLDHLQFIFHSPKTALYFLSEIEQFSLDSVRRNVKNVECIHIITGNREYNGRILRLFQPASFQLVCSFLIDRSIPRDILIQNFDHMKIVYTIKYTLNDLLMTNAQSVIAWSDRLSSKLLNKSLKLWIKGSNPRLEWMALRITDVVFRTEELLEGLSYKDVPMSTVKHFKLSRSKETRKVSGGWDIKRFDGTQATILVEINAGAFVFKLFVWHDHCVVNSIIS